MEQTLDFVRRTFIGATHWRGEHTETELTARFGRLFELHDGALRVFNLGTHTWSDVPIGSWVLKSRSGNLTVVADEDVRLYARLRLTA